MLEKRLAIIIPTLNAGDQWQTALEALRQQTAAATVLVIDSASVDTTVEQARACGYAVHGIHRGEFDHGATRQLAAGLVEAELLVYLTQDAVLADPQAVARLVAAFDDPSVGAAYGRQLPRPGAGPIEAHARLFNYAASGHLVTPQTAGEWGIKAPFMSNSFAAYRRSALQAAGGFPSRVIQSEDMYVGARMLQAGWSLAYVAEATVFHSHRYGLRQDFQRYFDIGVFHAHTPWIRTAFGQAGGEGFRFLRSELAYLLRHAPLRLPEALLRTAAKFIGYYLGLRESRLPLWLKRRFSTQKHYWREAERSAAA